MDIVKINNIKCVNLESVALFLEYKHINRFINSVKKQVSEIFDGVFISTKSLICFLVSKKRPNINKLVEILLDDDRQNEINIIKKEVINHLENVKCNNLRAIEVQKSEDVELFYLNLHTILSAYKLKIISCEKCLTLLSYYDIFSIQDGEDLLWDSKYEDSLPLSEEDIMYETINGNNFKIKKYIKGVDF